MAKTQTGGTPRTCDLQGRHEVHRDEVYERDYGPNELKEIKGKPLRRKFAENFYNLFAGERLLSFKVLARAYLFPGPIQAAAAMSAFFFRYFRSGWNPGEVMAATGPVYVQATTMTHAAVVMTQVGNGFAQRTTRESIFKVGLFSNRFSSGVSSSRPSSSTSSSTCSRSSASLSMAL